MKKLMVFFIIIFFSLFSIKLYSGDKFKDSDRDGISDNHDMCPYSKEIVNGINDSDGCPDTLFVRVIGKIGTKNKGVSVVTIKSVNGERMSFKVRGNEFEWVTNIPQMYEMIITNGKCTSDPVKLFLQRGEIVKIYIPLKCPTDKLRGEKNSSSTH